MANAVVEVAGLPTGLTLTGDFYPRGSDTAGASAKSFTERTNSKGIYRCTVTEGLSGWYRVLVKSGSDVIATYDVLMSDVASDHYAHDDAIEKDAMADAFLNRDMSTGTDSGSATVRTVRQALRFLRNKWTLTGTTLSVKKEDDSTESWTASVTTDAAADPITGSDPAS